MMQWFRIFAVALCVGGLMTQAAEKGAVPMWNEARWIGFTDDQRDPAFAERASLYINQTEPVQRRSFPSSLLRREFSINKKVQTATAYVCGLGLHELYLNGQKIGDRVLDPAPTSYEKRAFYVVHDVTEQIRSGSNAIGLMLGNGFYGQNFAFGGGLAYGPPRAKMVLVIKFTDGASQRVLTDEHWQAHQSPVVFDNIYAGETYDARRELPGWSEPDFNSKYWKPVREMEPPTTNLVEQRLEPIRKVRAIRPVAILPAADGEWIVDLGENIGGWLQLRVREPRGTKITMRFAELLMPDGKAIDTASTGVHVTSADQTDIYVCKGGGVEEWEPCFTYHGFRYAQVAGLSKKPALADFTGWLVRSDLERIGHFECSDPILNKFYEVSLRTIEGNLQGLLSDCPHRERCAWLGDMHAVAETISMNYDARSLWRKHIEDFKTVLGASIPVPRHYAEGDIPPRDPRAPANIACGKRLCGQARPDWGMAVVLVPWFNWLYCGDRETALNAWPMMADYMDYLQGHEVNKCLIKEGFAYGDWCPPGGNKEMDTPPNLTASALYYQSAIAMERMAGLMGKTGAETKYRKLAEDIKTAFNEKFMDRDTYDYGSQTATAMALNIGLVPKVKEGEVATGLNRLIIEQSSGHYTSGMLGHRHLYTALNDYGFGEATRRLWGNTDFPSLAFLTEAHGLTTWPEVPMDWPAGERYQRNSFNHPMQSGFAVTFHESLGGIRPDPEQPGFKHFILKPCFLPGLEWVKVNHRSPRGLISSHWKREGASIRWSVTVPENASAAVKLSQFEPFEIKLNDKPVDDNNFELPAGSWIIDLVISLRN
ncbi:family 78 glycoside hydrolase catalytic domain [Pontiellaceae bacterium B12227]|nr:family 78 glycoside hydrolase catalytic domain [Pontiellaceae bacterium B12227]